MDNFFSTLKGGNFVLIINDNAQQYIFAENSVILIDDWYLEVKDGSYFEMIKEYKVSIDRLKKAVAILRANTSFDEYQNIMNWNKPVAIIDFDKKEFINNFYDQALEDRVPETWKGKFIRDSEEFLKLIPTKMNYWM